MSDDKLREILKQYWIFESSKPDETIAQIHKAFADEGYFKPGDGNYAKFANLRLEGRPNYEDRVEALMTGAEWYSRFEKELPERNITLDDAIRAAKRAAGIGE